MKSFLTSVVVLLILVAIAPAQAPGDMPPPPLGAEFDNPADVYVNEAVDRALQMLNANDAAGALALLNEKFDHLSRLRSIVFAKILCALATQNRTDEARDLFLRNAPLDPEMARAGIDQVYACYTSGKDPDALLALTKQLSEMALPDDLKLRAAGWYFSALCSNGIRPAARAEAERCMAQFGPAESRSIFEPVVSALVSAGKLDDAAKVLDIIEKASGKDAGLISMTTAERIRLIFLRKNWKEGETAFAAQSGRLADGDLAALIAFIASAATNKDEATAVDRMAVTVLKKPEGRNAARNAAAAAALKALEAAGRAPEIPARLEQAMAAGMTGAEIYPLFCDYFYTVILLDNKPAALEMLAFGGKLKAVLTGREELKQVTLFLMDGSFAIGDYARALAILDAGRDYWKQDWLESTRAKVGAHLDLEQKNYKGAVEKFRIYMDYVAKNNTSAFNPATGQIYTRDMILGFNALRIGDLLRDHVKDESGSRKAYAEAEQYFRSAIKNVKPNSKESKYIDDQMAQLASRMGK